MRGNKKARVESNKMKQKQNKLEVVEEEGKDVSDDETPVKTAKNKHTIEESKAETGSDVIEEPKVTNKELIASDLDTDSENEDIEMQTIDESVEVEEEINDSDSDSNNDDEEEDDDDDSPEGFSLKESKERAQQMIKQTQDAHKSIKSQKKKILQDRQLKNREQKQNKTTAPEHDSDENDENDEKVDEIINSILDEVNKPKTVITTQPKAKNQKIIFDDNEVSELSFDDEDIEMEKESLPKIKAQHLYSVDKIKDIGSDARAFLQQHFFGNRLQREKITKSKYVKRSKKKTELIGRRKKV